MVFLPYSGHPGVQVAAAVAPRPGHHPGKREASDDAEREDLFLPPPVAVAVAAAARDLLLPLQGVVPPLTFAQVQHLVEIGHHEWIDYEMYSGAFAYSYFLSNFWKAFRVVSSGPSSLPRRVLDAGGGSGAALLATLAWLDTVAAPDVWSVQAVLVDRSGRQGALAAQLVEAACPALEHLRIDFRFRADDLLERSAWEDDVDLVLLSHVLTENAPNVATFLRHAADSLRADGSMVVLERIDDDIWASIDEVLPSLALSGRVAETEMRTETPAGEVPMLYPPDASLESSLATRYVWLRAPHWRGMSALVQRYFCAWRSRDVSLLDEVFSADATYRVHPNRPPIEGLEGIREYWRREVLPQRNIRTHVRNLLFGEALVEFEWDAEFELGATHVELDGLMSWDVDTRRGRITALRESFRATRRPHGPG